MYTRILFLLSIILTLNCQGQSFALHSAFEGFLDNREYFNEYTDHQTFFGNRIKLSNNVNVLNHNIEFGIDYTYEFGSLVNNIKPKLIANYNYESERIKFLFGTFNRQNLINFPSSFLHDSLYYYRALLEGCLLKYKYSNGYQQAWIDWTSRQTDTIRETFLAGLSGFSKFNNFFIKHYLLMYHYAKPKTNVSGLSIRDNGGFSLNAGYNFKSIPLLDSLTISAGGSYSYDRNRGVYGLQNYISYQGGLNVYYKKFGINCLINSGDGLLMLYGDKIYRAKKYARFDVYFHPSNDIFNHTFMLSFHVVDGEVDYSQLINIKFNINQPYYTINK